MEPQISPELLDGWLDQHGRSLLKLSEESILLINFLRHAGCPFCRETLGQLNLLRTQFEQVKVQIVLIHMMTDKNAEKFFSQYNLSDVPRFSDPDKQLYQAFDLARGSLLKVMGPAVWWQGLKTTLLKGNLPGTPQGDVFQLAGTFILKDGDIIAAHRATSSSHQVDLLGLSAVLPR